MLPPGLLPESSEPRRATAGWILGAVVLMALLALFAGLVHMNRLSRERDDARRQVGELLSALQRRADPPPLPVQTASQTLDPPPLLSPPAPLPPRQTPEIRVRPNQDRDASAEKIVQGLHEFRAARYPQAELQFFRALPESYLYLALAGLARGDWREALGFLSRAMSADPQWLERVKPRDLFGTEEEYQRVLRGVEGRLAENPLDVEAKVLLAYLRYHDQGAPYAKALLIEVATLHPDQEEAKKFLEALGP